MGRRGVPAPSQLSSDLPVVPDGAGPAFGIVVENAENSEMDVKVLFPIQMMLTHANRRQSPNACQDAHMVIIAMSDRHHTSLYVNYLSSVTADPM